MTAEPILHPCAMTAEVTPTPVTDELRDEVRTALERLREEHQNKQVDDGHVLGCMRDWRPDLSAVGLWALWEHIDTAIERLDHVRSPMFCPSEGDQELLEQEWDASLEFGIDRLMGVRP